MAPSDPRPAGRRAPAPLPAVLLARELAPAAVRAGTRSGELERLRPGAYRRVPLSGNPVTTSAGGNTAGVAAGKSTGTAGFGARNAAGGRPSGTPSSRNPVAERELALARIAAVGRQLRTPFWFSHESAALIWGLPLWTSPTTTHIIQTVQPTHHGDPSLVRHLMALPPTDRETYRGVPVTSLGRTVIDCLRHLAPRDALVIADGALRSGADREELKARLDALAGGRGVLGARTVLDHADGRAESPWETFVRYLVLRHGLPRPQLQIRIKTRLGWFRADLGWTEWRLLLEVDGYVKYSTSDDPARTVFEEKRRQDAITDEGWAVMRITTADAARSRELLDRVCARLPPEATARLTPVRGWTEG